MGWKDNPQKVLAAAAVLALHVFEIAFLVRANLSTAPSPPERETMLVLTPLPPPKPAKQKPDAPSVAATPSQRTGAAAGPAIAGRRVAGTWGVARLRRIELRQPRCRATRGLRPRALELRPRCERDRVAGRQGAACDERHGARRAHPQHRRSLRGREAHPPDRLHLQSHLWRQAAVSEA